jgi:omega-3 fatty acid desaturase (delta-15 desaturase)
MCRAPDWAEQEKDATHQKQKYREVVLDQKYPSLGQIKSWLPKEVFELSTAKSMAYWARDVADMAATMGAIAGLCRSGAFAALPFALQCALLLPLQFAAGFFMWCMFVVGHDCGHTTFSPHQPVNELMGELSHSVLLCTPFAPWRRSHHRHHSYHNHIKEDYSHMWYTESQRSKVLRLPHLAVHYTIRVVTPFLNWWTYLYVGQPDGGHLFLYGRLWKDATVAEMARGYVSSAVSVAAMYGWYALFGDAVVRAYCMPWMWYGWWLFTVTFFQHHFDEMLLFREGAWSYVRGAFETIDRTFGRGVDHMHHNITDGHVVHHLFFTKIPHFHLMKATHAMRQGLAKEGFAHLYKHQDTPAFAVDIHKFLHKNWFWVKDEKVVNKVL